MDYDQSGRVEAVSFTIDIDGKLVGFRLPAKVENVEKIFYQKKKPRYNWSRAEPLTDAEKEQAYRTAWANVADWIEAQMAMIDTQMVKLEEIFLPYAIDRNGKTYFENIRDNKFMLEAPAPEGQIVEG